jgi:hypothetical protein
MSKKTPTLIGAKKKKKKKKTIPKSWCSKVGLLLRQS